MGEIAQFTGGKVPQKLQALAGDNTDLSAGVRGGYSVLSIRGSRWHVKVGDEETTITNDDGDPIGSLRLVLLKASPNVSKNYYAGGYEEGSTDAPTCWSIDGIRPDPAADKQADSCAVCPKNVFGSRITDAGKKVKACGDSRRLAVIPEGDFKNDIYGGPMLLRVPASSLSNLSVYGKKMDRQGFPYNTIITRLSFDHTVSFPKLEFNAVRPLTDDEADEIISLINNPEFADKIEAVLAKDLEVVPVEDEDEDDKPLFEEPPEKPKAKKKKATKKKAVADAKDNSNSKGKSEASGKAEASESVESDESDDELDDELADILGSLDNLD
jgi:hypothetical protein